MPQKHKEHKVSQRKDFFVFLSVLSDLVAKKTQHMKQIIPATTIISLLILISTITSIAQTTSLPTPQNLSIDTITSVATWQVPGDTSKILYPGLLGYLIYLNDSLVDETTDTSYTFPYLEYGQEYKMGVAAKYSCGNSETILLEFTSGFLPIPGNLSGENFDDAIYIEWDYPFYDPGLAKSHNSFDSISIPGLVGYNIYRDGDSIGYVPDSVLEYYDFNMFHGWYEYMVTGVYDMSYYGYSGFMESQASNKVEIHIYLYCGLPLFEDWQYGNFEVNGWVHTDCENWKILVNEGNPAPTAAFVTDTILYDYSCSIISYPHLGYLVEDGNIYLDFELKLNDLSASNSEKFTISVLQSRDTSFIIEEISNNGSFDWTHYSYNISQWSKGVEFRIVFSAGGENNENIESWMIDNIYLYVVCQPPLNLQSALIDLPDEMYSYLCWEAPLTSNNNDSRDIVGYNIYRKIEGINNEYEIINEDIVFDTSYADYDLIAEGIYSYGVSTIYDQCESQRCDTTTLDVIFTSVQQQLKPDIALFPNPADKKLDINFNQAFETIYIFDIKGNIRYTQNKQSGNTISINTTSWNDGIYLVKINLGEETYNKKLLIKH